MCFPWTRKKDFVKLKEECSICLGAIISNSEVICGGCSKLMHKKCLKRWEKACQRQELDFTCPMCRARIKI